MEQNEAIIKALTISIENMMVFPQSKRPWTNDAAIVDMISLCRDEEDYALVSDMFHQLNENIIDGTKCYELLFEMAMAIKKNEIEGNQTALCVMSKVNYVSGLFAKQCCLAKQKVYKNKGTDRLYQKDR